MKEHLFNQLKALNGEYVADFQLLTATLDETALLNHTTRRQVELLDQEQLAVEHCFERIQQETRVLMEKAEANRKSLALAKQSLAQRNRLKERAGNRLLLQVQRLDWMLEAYDDELTEDESVLKACFLQLRQQYRELFCALLRDSQALDRA